MLKVDLFAEDRAHEQFLPHLIERLTNEAELKCQIRVVSARGGHPRVANELDAYQKVIAVSGGLPDLLVIGVDANCRGFQEAKQQYELQLSESLRLVAVIAAPDPHVERWYMVDGKTFSQVVGTEPVLPAKKCDHEGYKIALERAVWEGNEIVTLGGLEFGPEIAKNMDLYRAGKADGALKHFVSDLRAKLNEMKQAGRD